jgi:hypothetical protein
VKVYKDDSDEFDPEYLEYLGTLTTQAGNAKYRISRNAKEEVVRMEFWLDGSHYIDLPFPGWMKP